MSRVAIVIVAGGDAVRLPRKLERHVGGEPLLVHVYRNLRGEFPVYISARSSFPAEIDEQLDCPIVIDRWHGRGPLGGLLTTFGAIDAQRIFVAAGDAPAITLAVPQALLQAWQSGDEVAIPSHDERIEPLAALYDRVALLREGWAAMERGDFALHGLVGRMKVRRVELRSDFFVNVNTPADLARIGAPLSKGIG